MTNSKLLTILMLASWPALEAYGQEIVLGEPIVVTNETAVLKNSIDPADTSAPNPKPLVSDQVSGSATQTQSSVTPSTQAPIQSLTPGEGASRVSPVVPGANTSGSTTADLAHLKIPGGERLMPSLKSWLQAQHIDLVWNASTSTAGHIRDVVIEDDYESSTNDVRSVLSEILEPFGFEAEVAQSDNVIKRVTVRNALNAL